MPFPLPLGAAGEFWHVVKELSPATIRAEAERTFHIVVMGKAGAESIVAGSLIGKIGRPLGASRVLSKIDLDVAADSRWIPRADAYIYVASGAPEAAAIEQRRIADLHSQGCPVVVVGGGFTGDDGAPWFNLAGISPWQEDVWLVTAANKNELGKLVGDALLRALADLRLSLARHLSGLRETVGDSLIGETARVNAEFAFASDLPAAIPLIGGVFGGAADFLVLTKNEGMLVFKLAAIHGRDLRSNVPLLLEIAPVVGAAFLWRTIARSLVGMLPPMVSVVPKTTIAYVGTYVVGKMAQYYYANDLRPRRDMIDHFTAEAMASFKQLAGRFSRR